MALQHAVAAPLVVLRAGQLMVVGPMAPLRATLVAEVGHKVRGRRRVVLKPKPRIAVQAKAELSRQRAMKTATVTVIVSMRMTIAVIVPHALPTSRVRQAAEVLTAQQIIGLDARALVAKELHQQSPRAGVRYGKRFARRCAPHVRGVLPPRVGGGASDHSETAKGRCVLFCRNRYCARPQ